MIVQYGALPKNGIDFDRLVSRMEGMAGPKSHQAHLEWTPSRMVHWAEQIGPNTAQLFARILAEKPHPEMGYRSCLGIIRLAEKYSAVRMEAAADRALLTGACRYQSVKSILKNSLDQHECCRALAEEEAKAMR
jgi:hypothetical protein